MRSKSDYGEWKSIIVKMSSPTRKVSQYASLTTLDEVLKSTQGDQQTIKAKLKEASIQAAKAINDLQQLKTSNSSEQLEKIKYLRWLQYGLLNFCLDDKLEMEKFGCLMHSAHDQFKNTQKQIRSERMEVDWQSQRSYQEENKASQQSQPTEQPQTRDEFSYSLLDAVWMRRQVTGEEGEGEKGVSQTKKLKDLLTMLNQKKVITQRQALEVLEAKTLGAIGFVKREEDFTKKNRGFFTRTYFEQQKFNLLREENEGFSKLIIELNQGNIGNENIKVVKQNIQSLIGYFSLDPNRLIDLLLSAFENNVQNLAYLSLLKEFGTPNAITQLIGFKIQRALLKSQIGEQGVPERTVTEEVNQSLFELTALLIKHEVIELADVWPHLEHTLKRAEGAPDEIETLLKKQIDSLQYQYKTLAQTITDQDALRREMDEQKIELDHAEIERLRSKMPQNFKLRLLQGCIKVNDWETADDIVHGIYEGRLDLTLSMPLLKTISEALSWFIAKLYAPLSVANGLLEERFSQNKKGPFLKRTQHSYFNATWEPESNTEVDLEYHERVKAKQIMQATSNQELFDQLPKILSVLGIYIGFDEKTFTKLLKVIVAATRDEPALVQKGTEICGEVFLPALALTSDNYAIENLIWQILKQAPFKIRYFYYSTMLTETYLSSPQMIAKQVQVVRQIGRWARRLDTDQIKQKSRPLTKAASGNALIAFDSLISSAKAYDNQIDPQIMAISFSQDLSLDTMAFTIVRHLADSTKRPLDGKNDIAAWLQNLSEFAAQFFRKYQTVDMSGLLTYLVHKLRDEDDSFYLGFMINRIISKMFGWTDREIHQLTESQLNTLAGGFVLMLEGRNQSQQFKTNKKSIESLEKLFWDQKNDGHEKIGLRLMVHLARQAQFVLHSLKSPQLLSIARQYDTMHKYFTHLVDTLSFIAETPKKFYKLLPENPVKTLGYEYRLPPQYTFHIYRCSLPHIHNLSEEAFSQAVYTFKNILDYSLQSRIDVALESENAIDNEYWDEAKFVTKRKEEAWKILKPELYCIFWYMNIQSLLVCEKEYHDEIKKVTDQIEQLKNKPLDNGFGKVTADQQGPNQKKNQKESDRQLKKLQKELQSELDFQVEVQKQTHAFLEKRIRNLFENVDKKEICSVLLQYCFFPRLLHSPKDALYSFQFIELLKGFEVPNFNILQLIATILKCVAPVMYFCSEAEAENLGIFFVELFKQLEVWKIENMKESIAIKIKKQFAKVLLFCFDKSKEKYMRARCALLILNRMKSIFPNTYEIAVQIQSKLQDLVDAREEIKPDLFILAQSCNEELKKRIQKFPEYTEKKRLEQKEAKLKAEQKEAEAKAAEQEAAAKKAAEEQSARGNGNAKEPSSRVVKSTPPNPKPRTSSSHQDKETPKDSQSSLGNRDNREKERQSAGLEKDKTHEREKATQQIANLGSKSKDGESRQPRESRPSSSKEQQSDQKTARNERQQTQGGHHPSSASKSQLKAADKEQQRVVKVAQKTGQVKSDQSSAAKGTPNKPSGFVTPSNSRPQTEVQDPRSTKRPNTEYTPQSSSQKGQSNQNNSHRDIRENPGRDNRPPAGLREEAKDSRKESQMDRSYESNRQYESYGNSRGPEGNGNRNSRNPRDESYRQADRAGDRMPDRQRERPQEWKEGGRMNERQYNRERSRERFDERGRGGDRRDYQPQYDHRYGREGGRGPRHAESPNQRTGGGQGYMGVQGRDQFSPHNNQNNQGYQDSRYGSARRKQ